MQHFDQEKTLCFIELMFRQDKSVIVLKVTLCFTSERTDGQNRTRPEHVLRCSPAVFHQLPWSHASYHFVVFWPTVWRVTRCCYKHVAVWQFISRAERLHHLRNHFRTCQHRISCCKCFYVLSVLPVSLHTVSLRDKWGKDCFQDKLTTAWLIFWPQ